MSAFRGEDLLPRRGGQLALGRHTVVLFNDDGPEDHVSSSISIGMIYLPPRRREAQRRYIFHAVKRVDNAAVT